MIEAAITWAGVLAALGIVCKTTLEGIKLYYRDREKVRLERLDRQLQLGMDVDQNSVLSKIVDLAATRLYPYQIGEGVIDEIKKHKLITSERARYVLIGADKNRGE